MKAAQQSVIDPNDPPSFEKVWKMFQETDRKFQEQMAESNRKFQKQREVMDKQLQETWEQIKATDKKVGELTNRFGDMVEHMVVPNLLAKFKALGFTFEVAHKNTEIKDEKNKLFLEVDVLLENGDKVMVVEIKATPRVKDVNDHIKRIEALRKHADARKDARKYLGAIAGVVTSEPVKTYALKQGFFVIVPSGDTFNIIQPEGKYHLREW
jgi:hypothetical protein